MFNLSFVGLMLLRPVQTLAGLWDVGWGDR